MEMHCTHTSPVCHRWFEGVQYEPSGCHLILEGQDKSKYDKGLQVFLSLRIIIFPSVSCLLYTCIYVLCVGHLYQGWGQVGWEMHMGPFLLGGWGHLHSVPTCFASGSEMCSLHSSWRSPLALSLSLVLFRLGITHHPPGHTLLPSWAWREVEQKKGQGNPVTRGRDLCHSLSADYTIGVCEVFHHSRIGRQGASSHGKQLVRNTVVRIVQPLYCTNGGHNLVQNCTI